MAKSEFNYLEFDIKIDNDNETKNEINLVGIHPFYIVAINMKLLPLEEGLFKGFNENNSKIFINNEKLEPFSLIHKFQEIGTYKIKIEVNEKLKDLSFLFYKCQHLTKVDLSHLDTTEVTTLEGAFEGSINLEEINLENINTDKLENLYGAFCACENLKEIKGIENINTKNVKDIRCFTCCKKLEKLNLEK